MNFSIGGGRQWKLGDIVTWPVDLLKTEVCNSYVAICPQIFRHSWEIWKISCVKVEGCRSMASASIPLTDFVKSSKFCGNPSVPWARSRQRKLAPTLWLKLGNVICSSYTIRTIWRKGLASNARWDKYLSFVSCFSQLFLDIYMNYHVQQDRKHTQQSTLKAVSGKNLTTFFGQSSKHSALSLSLCATHRLSAALHEGAFLGLLPLLLSLKSLCHRVACPALTALWLSRDTFFVAPFCHGDCLCRARRRAFVMWHPLLFRTRYMSRKSRLGGPYLTIACVELIRRGPVLGGKMGNGWASHPGSHVQDGLAYIYVWSTSNVGCSSAQP